MKNKWSNYALKDGKVKSSYIREYSNRKKVWKTREASNCNSNEQSGQEQAKEEVELIYKPTIKESNENIREENTIETHQEGRQGIQESNQGRCKTKKRNSKVKSGSGKEKEITEIK